MILRISMAVAMLMSVACGAGRPAAEPEAATAAEPRASAEPALDIAVEQLAGPVWIHRSRFETDSWGLVEANGLVVFGERGAVLVDTAWTPAQARWLLDWIERESGREALAVIVTHSHGDRSAGIGEALARGIPVHGSQGTAELLRQRGEPAPSQVFEDELELDLGGVALEAFYPGPGHTADNSVVYVADQAVLFGGCLIRAAATDDLGNVADADVAAWPETMRRLIERYGSARRVVPGHGAVGDAALLEHTRDLAARGR